ncbi:MAG: ROK family protein [Planctomycetota bacterium]
MTEQKRKAAIGLDVGGTAIKAGLVTAAGEVLARATMATETDRGVDHVIGNMVRLIDELRSPSVGEVDPLQTVGLGMPGTLSRQRGIVISPPNLPGWRDVPIVDRLGAATGLRVILDNDANNAALGEYLCGAGSGIRDMAMLTLGTGIGGGLILDGRLWHGAYENGGELGHMIVHAGGRRCKCGQMGCLEAYASATNIAIRAMEAVEAGEPSCLKDIRDRGQPIRAEMIAEAFAAGDPVATFVWTEACRYLAIACANIQHMLNVERIVLAGGLSGAGERLRQPVVQALEEVSSGMLGASPEIRIARLGNDAGFIGSALSAFQPD